MQGNVTDWVPIFGIMIPIVGTIMGSLVVIALVYFRYRERTKLQDTLRALAQTESPHQEALLGVLTKAAQPTAERDIRMAILLFSLALGLVALAFMIGLMDDDGDGYFVIWPLVAVAVFPFSFGVGRLLLWRMAVKRGEA